MVDREFSQEGYRALLLNFRKLGYSPSFLHRFEAVAGTLISRHDIDISLPDALTVARIEGELGWQSDFYFLLTSDLYNLSSARSKGILKEIASLGHAIGLHFDASLYGDPASLTREQLSYGIQAEAENLRDIIDGPVYSVSFHRPLKRFQGMPGLLAGLPHAYEPRFFCDVAYVSDSKGGWHHGHPLDHQAVSKQLPLQLLTHPIWWTQKLESITGRLESFISERNNVMRDEFVVNITSYRKPSNN
jgi:hypothetical protein